MVNRSADWVGATLSRGRYVVEAKLGEGGMGFVYRVSDRNLNADVVVKVPRRSMLEDPEFAPRFATEIRSLVRLAHPHIVKVSDVGEHEGLPFAVMQFLSGGSLEDRLAAGGMGRPTPVDPETLRGWLPSIAAALDFVHSQGFVHRDVKPGNILFDAHGHAALSDFGVAKVLASAADPAEGGRTSLTGAGLVLGTPEYMAPELILGRPIDGGIDQYALALTAYEVLAGRRPFEGTGTAVLVRQAHELPPPLATPGSGAVSRLSAVILRGLAKDPSDRYPTCAEFARAVVAILDQPGRASLGEFAQVGPAAIGRVACPSCGKGLSLPASARAEPESLRGRTLRCPACRTALRFGDAGHTLVAEGTKPPASGAATQRFAAPPVVSATGSYEILDLEAHPSLVSTPRRTRPPSTPLTARRTVAASALPEPPEPPGIVDAPPRSRAVTAPTNGRRPLSIAVAVGAGGVLAAGLLVAASLTFGRAGKGDRDTAATTDTRPLVAILDSPAAPARPSGSAGLGLGLGSSPGDSGGKGPGATSGSGLGGGSSARVAVAEPDPTTPVQAKAVSSEGLGFGGDAVEEPADSPPTSPSASKPDSPGQRDATREAPATQARPADQPDSADQPDPEDAPEPSTGTARVAKPVPLEELMRSPNKYADSLMIPSGVYFVENILTRFPDATESVIVSLADRRAYPDAEAGPRLILDPGVARQLRGLIQSKALPGLLQEGYSRARGDGRITLPAAVTVRIDRPIREGATARVTIIRLDLFRDLDLAELARERWARAFICAIITPERCYTRPSIGRDWKNRLPKDKLARVIQDAKLWVRMQRDQQNRAISQSMGASINRMSSQQDAEQSATLRRIWGR